MHEIEAEREAERFADNMSRRSSPRRCVTVLAGIGLDECDQVSERMRRYRWVNGDYQSGENRERNQVEILSELIGDLAVQCGIDHIAWTDHEQRVAIGRHFCHAAHGNIAASTTHILDVELLARCAPEQILRTNSLARL